MPSRIAFGFLGTNLDAYGGSGEKRHSAWRPTVSFAIDKSLALDRFVLWHPRSYGRLATTIKEDIEKARPTVTVELFAYDIKNPWNFEEMYGFLYDFSQNFTFKDSNEYFLHITTGTHVAQICLFLLCETRHFPAKLVQVAPRSRSESGRDDVSIVDLHLASYDKIAQRFEAKHASDLSMLKAGIGTRNEKFNALILQVEQVAKAGREPILLLGPTGAGKSHLAKQIYALKQVNRQLTAEFVEVNCATLRGDQASSTLFGHAKGSFTGAISKRDGILKRADGGLLFLDEIGELGLDEQAMLLRALEEKKFLPVGSDKEECSDFQLIAGTNRDLQVQVARGLFRDDLLNRINIWSFTLPSLAERLEDLEPNLDHELKKFEVRTGRRITMSAEARTTYLTFGISKTAQWSGNFRDLNSSVIRMATLSTQGRITESDVALELERLKTSWKNAPPRIPVENDDEEILKDCGLAASAFDPFDVSQLAAVIRVVRKAPSIAEAGKELFAASRTKRRVINDSDRLRKYLARFGLDAHTFLRDDP